MHPRPQAVAEHQDRRLGLHLDHQLRPHGTVLRAPFAERPAIGLGGSPVTTTRLPISWLSRGARGKDSPIRRSSPPASGRARTTSRGRSTGPLTPTTTASTTAICLTFTHAPVRPEDRPPTIPLRLVKQLPPRARHRNVPHRPRRDQLHRRPQNGHAYPDRPADRPPSASDTPHPVSETIKSAGCYITGGVPGLRSQADPDQRVRRPTHRRPDSPVKRGRTAVRRAHGVTLSCSATAGLGGDLR